MRIPSTVYVVIDQFGQVVSVHTNKREAGSESHGYVVRKYQLAQPLVAAFRIPGIPVLSTGIGELVDHLYGRKK